MCFPSPDKTMFSVRYIGEVKRYVPLGKNSIIVSPVSEFNIEAINESFIVIPSPIPPTS